MANSSKSKTCDIFVSSTAHDARLAMEVAAECRANGLDAYTHNELLSSENHGDAIWDALAESRAFLAIFPPSGLTSSMGFEIGGALAWNKPIYGLVTDLASTRLPVHLMGIRLYPIDRLQDVIESIKLSVQPLSDEEHAFLVKLYLDLGVTVDQLSLAPKPLGDLVTRFNKGRKKLASGERLLSELLRLRKQGKLVKTRPLTRTTSRSKSS